MLDRRRLLRSVGLGGVAGFGLMATSSEVGAIQSGRLILRSPFLRASAPPRSSPEVGSSSQLVGHLVDESGDDVGTFQATRVVLGGGPTTEITCTEQHVFELPGGRLFGAGTSTRSRGVIDTFAVTGGVGDYVGVRGSYDVQHDDFHMGGNGNAQFDFQLRGVD